MRDGILTNKEYVVKMLEKGNTLYRTTSKGNIISYTLSRKGVYRKNVISGNGKYISMCVAISQLVRNFTEIN